VRSSSSVTSALCPTHPSHPPAQGPFRPPSPTCAQAAAPHRSCALSGIRPRLPSVRRRPLVHDPHLPQKRARRDLRLCGRSPHRRSAEGPSLPRARSLLPLGGASPHSPPPGYPPAPLLLYSPPPLPTHPRHRTPPAPRVAARAAQPALCTAHRPHLAAAPPRPLAPHCTAPLQAPLSTDAWSIVDPANCGVPQQADAKSCGVFTYLAAMHRVHGYALSYTQVRAAQCPTPAPHSRARPVHLRFATYTPCSAAQADVDSYWRRYAVARLKLGVRRPHGRERCWPW